MSEAEHPFDGKVLFEVEIQQTIMVMASDESDAVDIAKEEAFSIEWNDADYDAREASYVVGAWAKSEPYGSDLRLTCDQIMEKLEEYERNRPPTKAELEAMGQQRLMKA